MRPVLINDVLAAVSVLAGAAEPLRPDLARGMVMLAQRADGYRLATGRVHPKFGNGTLLGIASKFPANERVRFSDGSHLQAWAVMIDTLRAIQPDAHSTQRVTVGSNSSRFSGISSPQSSQ